MCVSITMGCDDVSNMTWLLLCVIRPFITFACPSWEWKGQVLRARARTRIHNIITKSLCLIRRRRFSGDMQWREGYTPTMVPFNGFIILLSARMCRPCTRVCVCVVCVALVCVCVCRVLLLQHHSEVQSIKNILLKKYIYTINITTCVQYKKHGYWHLTGAPCSIPRDISMARYYNITAVTSTAAGIKTRCDASFRWPYSKLSWK